MKIINGYQSITNSSANMHVPISLLTLAATQHKTITTLSKALAAADRRT